mmetsp:Transcript_11934/g.15937  ORF Transcript_11934/g.15937 Transcript_11934/m.15937 type:complete len:102 (-) Transcript_11934:17-322(-)
MSSFDGGFLMCEEGAADLQMVFSANFEKRSEKEEHGEPGVLSLVVNDDGGQLTINPTAVAKLRAENPRTRGRCHRVLYEFPRRKHVIWRESEKRKKNSPNR